MLQSLIVVNITLHELYNIAGDSVGSPFKGRVQAKTPKQHRLAGLRYIDDPIADPLSIT